MENALVDVNVAVYNHAPYLRQTLDSILQQRTDFNFRILVGDDCSVDGSTQIVKEYERNYPEKIEAVYQPVNLGLNGLERNGVILLKRSTAKYIALCDGDDYWVDSLKLQKQVRLLEANPDAVGCSTNVYEEINGEKMEIHAKHDTVNFEILATGNPLYTCTVLYRNIIEIPPWFTQCKMGDWIIWLLLTKKGHIQHIPDLTSVYRMNAGVWSTKSKKNNLIDIINAYKILIEKFEPEYRSALKDGCHRHYNQLLNLLAEESSPDFLKFFISSCRHRFDLNKIKQVMRYFYRLLS